MRTIQLPPPTSLCKFNVLALSTAKQKSIFPYAILLFGVLIYMSISVSESYAQGPYSSRSYRPQPAASNGGIFGALFGGGGQRRYRSPRSGYYSPYGYGNQGYGNQSYQGYGGYGTGGYGRYRTLCVRSCDGYYYPVSYSTTRASFSRDAKKCQSSCSVPAKLYIYRNPGGSVEYMVDLKGQPYAETENAFRYRTEYVKDCKCKPEPWSDEAKQEYARREAGETSDSEVKTASSEGNAPSLAADDAEPAAYSESPYSQARARSTRRRRSRNIESRYYDGQWWAGSW